MGLITKSMLEEYATPLRKSGGKYFEKSAGQIILEDNAELEGKKYDIFLSHSYNDAEQILRVRKFFVTRGYTVYIDWIDDINLSRKHVTPETANILKERMARSKCLLYATSDNANNSIWMPWELGYFDGLKGKVAILPIGDDDDENYIGREYLGLYPYVDYGPNKKNRNYIWVNHKLKEAERFWDWLPKKTPILSLNG